MKTKQTIGIWLMTVVAVIFGLMTIKSGGSVLFFDGVAREEAGNYVPLVLWFNFIAGFVYIITAFGLWQQKYWAVLLSVTIAFTTLVVFAVLGLHIFNEGLYESRTVVAMIFRSMVWALIAMFAYRKIILSTINQSSVLP